MVDSEFEGSHRNQDRRVARICGSRPTDRYARDHNNDDLADLQATAFGTFVTVDRRSSARSESSDAETWR